MKKYQVKKPTETKKNNEKAENQPQMYQKVETNKKH